MPSFPVTLGAIMLSRRDFRSFSPFITPRLAFCTERGAAAPFATQPSDRTYFAPGYYAANIADFDRNRPEFAHKAWNPRAS
jgi:hypothetical protein